MNDWIHQQEIMSEEKNKENEKIKQNELSDNNNNSDEDNQIENNNNYNEKFDISKYNVVSIDNMKDNEEKEEKNKEINQDNYKEAICIICQRKFPSFDKLKLHEQLSALHKQNLEKLKLSHNN